MSAHDLASGCIVGGAHTVQARLGGNLHATTYSGLTMPNREIAIKMFAAEVAQRPESLAALEHADRIVRGLPPHRVLQPLASGLDSATGLPYRVTLLSAHPSLAQLVEVCPLTIEEMLGVVSQLAELLDEAHARGLTHGALKPSNVFVGPAPGHPVQVDGFGASACLRAWPPAHWPAESKAWLAPEQLTDPLAGGPAVDVFSLALLAFFSLTRAAYFRAGETPSSGPRASDRAREYGITLPEELDSIFARALAASPGQRYTTPGAFAKTLRHAALGLSATAPATRFDVPSPAIVGTPSLAGTPVAMASDAAVIPPPLTRRRIVPFAIAGAAAIALVIFIGVRAARHESRSTVTATPTPTTTTPAAMPPVEQPSAAVATSTSTATPTPAPDPTPTPTPAPDDSPKGSLTVTCVPDCDLIKLDGRTMPDRPSTFRLAPGTYGIGVWTRGYYGAWQRAKVVAGEEHVVKFPLTRNKNESLTPPKKKKR